MVRKDVEKSTIKKSCAFSKMGLTKNIEVFVVMLDGWSIQQSYFSILMRVTWSDSVIYSSLAENLLNEFFYHHKNSKQKKHLIFHMLPWKKRAQLKNISTHWCEASETNRAITFLPCQALVTHLESSALDGALEQKRLNQFCWWWWWRRLWSWTS